MTNLFTPNGDRLFTTAEAAEYIQANLPEGEKWDRSARLYENVYWHIANNNINPYEVTDKADTTDDHGRTRRTILISQEELDRFLAHRPRQGMGRKIDLSEYRERILVVINDEAELEAIAKEMGCSVHKIKDIASDNDAELETIANKIGGSMQTIKNLAIRDYEAELEAIASEVGCSVRTIKRRLAKWADEEEI